MLVDSASPTITRRREPATMRPAGAQAVSACLGGRPFTRAVWVTRADYLTFPSKDQRWWCVTTAQSQQGRGPRPREIPHDGGQPSAQTAYTKPPDPPETHWTLALLLSFLKNVQQLWPNSESRERLHIWCVYITHQKLLWNLENVWLHPKLKCTQKN